MNGQPGAADRDFAVAVVRRLRSAGFQALWAGGCVRDLLLGNQPTDYDVATSATPDQVRQLFGRRLTVPVGISFGVVVVLSENRRAQEIEVATFRTDAHYSDGRHPDYVVFSTAEDDARRRDFTINGMFYDPLDNQFIDYVGGRQDLEQGTIRAIGQADARIGEDKLRMLRAIRFAARFGFDLEPETQQAIARHAAEIALVSGERIAKEMQKSLETDRASWSVSIWHETGLMAQILPELDRVWTDAGGRAITLLDGALASQLAVCRQWIVRLAALLWGALEHPAVRKAAVSGIGQRLKLANEQVAMLQFAHQSQPALQAARTAPWSHVQPQLIHPQAAAGLGLLSARQAAGEVSSQTLAWLLERSGWTGAQLNPPPLIDGRDLIARGMRPGPEFGDLLGAVRNMQLDGQLADRQSAIDYVAAYQNNHLPPPA